MSYTVDNIISFIEGLLSDKGPLSLNDVQVHVIKKFGSDFIKVVRPKYKSLYKLIDQSNKFKRLGPPSAPRVALAGTKSIEKKVKPQKKSTSITQVDPSIDSKGSQSQKMATSIQDQSFSLNAEGYISDIYHFFANRNGRRVAKNLGLFTPVGELLRNTSLNVCGSTMRNHSLTINDRCLQFPKLLRAYLKRILLRLLSSISE